MKSRQIISYSYEETFQLGFDFSKELLPGQVVAFFGDLAAGKTTFIKGLASALSGLACHEINSPTFTYLNIYAGQTEVYHFDLYRLRNGVEFFSMGFDEHFEAGGVCLVEWAERIEGHLPKGCVRVHMHHLEENQRRICIAT